MTTPHYSLIFSGILTLLYVFLSYRVTVQRRSLRIGLGTGDDPKSPLFRAVRVHGNFAEYAPLLVILLVLDEMTGASGIKIGILGSVIMISRGLHAWGITHSHGRSWQRFWGTVLTFACLTALGISLVIKGIA